MRIAAYLGSALVIVALAAGCGGEKKTVTHRETVQTVPAAPVVQQRRTVETTTEH